ncbi:MAG: AraC family transcriptional regulator [Salibacteraceae bacterium]
MRTYNSVYRSNDQPSFRISRLEDVHNNQEGVFSAATRYKTYTVWLIEEGKGEVYIDFKKYKLKDLQVYFLNPGQVHQLKVVEIIKGYRLAFSSDFLAENNIPVSFIENFQLYNNYGENPSLAISIKELINLKNYAQEMMQWQSGLMDNSERAIGALLSLFLIQCNHWFKKPTDSQLIELNNSVLKGFKFIVEGHFHEWHASGQYASQLHISSDELNEIIKSLIGQTAKEYVQSRIIIAAKRMLFFSDISIKDIASKLGFEELAHFNAFFTQGAHQTPLEFRKTKSEQ